MSACEKSVLDYLTGQNRPYSANDMLLNLHKEYGKAAILKALDLLVADGKVKEKVNGKQKAYVVNQTQLPTVSESELSKLESDVAAKQATLDRQSKNLAASEAALRKLASTPKTDEILSEIKFLNGNVGDLASMRENLSSLAAAGAEEPLDKKELDNMLAKKEGALKEWRRRKRLCLDVVDNIMESYEKSKRILLEDIGIETDEEAGVDVKLLQRK